MDMLGQTTTAAGVGKSPIHKLMENVLHYSPLPLQSFEEQMFMGFLTLNSNSTTTRRNSSTTTSKYYAKEGKWVEVKEQLL